MTELARKLGMTQPGAANTCGCSGRSGWCGTARQASSACTASTPESFDRCTSGPAGSSGFGTRSWTEIAPPERIALLHGESRGDPNAFESVITFAPEGAATPIEMRTVFPTKELRDEVVEKYHAIEGGQQTLSNLAAYVTEMVRKGAEDPRHRSSCHPPSG